jgi:hypothetical protein
MWKKYKLNPWRVCEKVLNTKTDQEFIHAQLLQKLPILPVTLLRGQQWNFAFVQNVCYFITLVAVTAAVSVAFDTHKA